MTGISRTESIIADSTASSSPSHPTVSTVTNSNASTLGQVKRVARTYGRPKANLHIEHVTRDDIGSRAGILRTAPRDADDQVIPESDDVDERVPAYDGFGWRAKLKAIDEDFDEIRAEDRTKAAPNVSDKTQIDASDSIEQILQPSATSPLSGLSHLSLSGTRQREDDPTPATVVEQDSTFSGLNLLSSDHEPTSSGLHGPFYDDGLGEPRPLSRRPRPSDQSAEASDCESTSPQHAYSINSPKNQSSPTPPTSPLVEVLASKEVSISEEEPAIDASGPEDTDIHSKRRIKGRGKGKTKRMKGPTKKDVLEIQKESARLLADQHVSIRRTQIQSVHSVASLFSKLKKTPTMLTRQDSDPITSFSSPTHPFKLSAYVAPYDDASPVKLDHLAGDSSRLKETTSNSSHVPSAPETTGKPVLDHDDRSILDPGGLLHDYNEEQRKMPYEHVEFLEAERRAKELEVRKRKALEISKAGFGGKAALSTAAAKKREDPESDDGLEIVEDMVGLPTRPHGRVGKTTRPLVGRPHITSNVQRAKRESISGPKTVSQRSLELAARPTFMFFQEKKGTQRKAEQGAAVSHKDLNKLMLQRAHKQRDAIEEKKMEQWVMTGGNLKTLHRSNASQKSMKEWLHIGSARENVMEVEDCDSEDGGEDPSYMPGDVEYHGGENSGEGSEAEAPDDGSPVERRMEISEDELTADTDKENHRPTLRKHAGRVIIDSDEEYDDASRAGPSQPSAVVFAPDTSFIEDPTGSPGEDKENSAELAFDSSEDKENARVPRHLPRGRVFSTSPSPSLQLNDHDAQVGREPLGGLEAEGGSAFMPSIPQRHDSSQSRVLQVLHEEDKYFTLSPIMSAKRALPRRSPPLSSPEPGDEHTEGLKPFFGGGFSQLFAPSDNGDADAPKPATAVGFSQFFSPGGFPRESPLNNKGRKPSVHQPSHIVNDDEFQFTQPNTLLPSVRISESQRREVDEMFGKDQEFRLDEAKRLREETRSGETTASEILDIKQFGNSPPELSPLSIRRPLKTLSLDHGDARKPLSASPDGELFRRGRLLRERPREPNLSSPPAPRNAFDVLRDAMAKGKGKERAPRRLERSDFIEVEAQESDEELMLGFGGAKGDEDEELGDDDPNGVVEGLVDDAAMDDKTQAADLVLEKHKEHQAVDDAAIEKLHQDAISGKLRGKRRDRVLEFEESDSEEDVNRGPRKPLNKKRRIEGDTLESYGQNPETKAFYDTYQAGLVEDADTRLAHLQSGDLEARDSDSGDEPDTVDSAEVRQRLRELSKRETSLESEHEFDDLSWMGNGNEETDGDEYQVKERPLRVKTSAGGNRPSLDHVDHWGTAKGKKEDSAERIQLKSWANQETRGQPSASGRGGFSRKEDSTAQSRKYNKIVVTGAATSGKAPAFTKSSSLMPRIEKRKGFDS